MDPRAEGDAKGSRNPFRCFDARFLLESLLVGFAIIGFALIARGHPPGSAMRIGLAALQTAAFGWIAARSVLSVRKLDELQRQIHLVGIAVGFTVGAILIVALGFFEKAGLPRLRWDAEIWIVMVGVWWLSAAVLARRYR